MNTNPQEVVTGPGPHLTYRTIGGQLELFFLPGPTPEEVIRQYQQIIGRPYLPAYWAFGYQVIRVYKPYVLLLHRMEAFQLISLFTY